MPHNYILDVHEGFEKKGANNRFLETFYDIFGNKRYLEVFGSIPSFDKLGDQTILNAKNKLEDKEIWAAIRWGYTLIPED